MNNTAWITDSTSSLSKAFIDAHDIHVIPLNVIINQTSYQETIDLTEEELYQRMEKEEDTFQTSLPSLGTFVRLYEQLKQKYEYGIALHVSSKLSGTYQTSLMAAEMTGFKVYHIDSLTGSYPLGHLIRTGIQMSEQGCSIEDILAHLNELKKRNRLLLLPENLNQLHKSGRVTGSQRLLASLLQIQPILAVEEGKAIIKDKVRSRKKAIEKIFQTLKEDMEHHTIHKIAIIHANNPVQAKIWEKRVKEQAPGIDTETLFLIPVAGVHTGAKTMGLSWVCE